MPAQKYCRRRVRKLKYITETFLEYPDNSSVAVIFYCGGCDRNCPGCHNTELQNYIKFDSEQVIGELVDYCKRLNTNKIVLCGGDPLYHKNLSLTGDILRTLGGRYDICIYTGANIDEVKALDITGFKFVKCGIFEASKFVGATKTDDYIRFATTNQELYDSQFNLLSKDGTYYFNEEK